jgi:hypothetical protein
MILFDQRKASSFGETIQRFLSPRRNSLHSQYYPNSSYLDLMSLYDLCLLIKSTIQSLGARSLIHDFLLMLFVECNESSPDVDYVLSWIRSRLWIALPPKDAEMLLKFMKLFRPLPSEEISEYDSFLCMEERDPLLLSSSHSHNVMSKEQWCELTSLFIKNRLEELFWDRAKLKSERKVLDGKFRSLVRLASDILQSKRISPAPTPLSSPISVAQESHLPPNETLTEEQQRQQPNDPNLVTKHRRQSIFQPMLLNGQSHRSFKSSSASSSSRVHRYSYDTQDLPLESTTTYRQMNPLPQQSLTIEEV